MMMATMRQHRRRQREQHQRRQQRHQAPPRQQPRRPLEPVGEDEIARLHQIDRDLLQRALGERRRVDRPRARPGGTRTARARSRPRRSSTATHDHVRPRAPAPAPPARSSRSCAQPTISVCPSRAISCCSVIAACEPCPIRNTRARSAAMRPTSGSAARSASATVHAPPSPATAIARRRRRPRASSSVPEAAHDRRRADRLQQPRRPRRIRVRDLEVVQIGQVQPDLQRRRGARRLDEHAESSPRSRRGRAPRPAPSPRTRRTAAAARRRRSRACATRRRSEPTWRYLFAGSAFCCVRVRRDAQRRRHARIDVVEHEAVHRHAVQRVDAPRSPAPSACDSARTTMIAPSRSRDSVGTSASGSTGGVSTITKSKRCLSAAMRSPRRGS